MTTNIQVNVKRVAAAFQREKIKQGLKDKKNGYQKNMKRA